MDGLRIAAGIAAWSLGWGWATDARAEPVASPVPVVPAGEPAEPPPIRDVNRGFGFGVAYLAAVNPSSRQRLGLHLELREEVPLSRAFQFDFGLSAGLTTPENTVAVAEWAYGAGGSITQAFGDVTDWVGEGRGDGLGHTLRAVGAFYAYIGLGVSYIIVPVTWIVSPVASVGHAFVGPSVSWHTGPWAPDGYVEAGIGGLLYGDPVAGGPEVGFGPMVGLGAHVGTRSVAARLLASLPRMHTGDPDPVLTGALVFGL